MSAPTDSRPKEFYDEFQEATKDMKFTKDFNGSLETVMHDEMATTGQRVLAWIKRRSWGNYRLFCVMDDGVTPALQRDCCAELGIDKTRLSHTISYLVKRGYIRYEDKLLIPVISPVLRGPGKERAASAEFQAFFEQWQVANSVDAEELKVARATLKRIRIVVLSAYKKSRASETNGGPSLVEIQKTPSKADPSPDGGAPVQSSSTEDSSVAVKPKAESSRKATTTKTNPKASGEPAVEVPAGGYASDRDELVALMKATLNRMPDKKAVRTITEALEIRGGTLREYLDDIKPRLERLRNPAREGFFIKHAQMWGGEGTTPAPAPETAESKEKRTGPCAECRGLGRVGDKYCDCPMGVDLQRVESRATNGQKPHATTT